MVQKEKKRLEKSRKKKEKRKKEKEDIGVEVWLKGGKGDRKRDSEQVLTCEHTVSGNRIENATVGYWIIYGTSNSIGKGIWEEIQKKKRKSVAEKK